MTDLYESPAASADVVERTDGRPGYESYADFASQGWGGDTKAQGPGRWLGLVFLVGLLVLLWRFGGPVMVIVVVGLILSIVLHELGHFLTAKWAGMKATEFFLGFGPRIWSTKRGETEYGVKVLPAGAYVRIIGMHNLEEVDPEDEAKTYRSKTYPKRLAVVLAGPAMNILLGFVILVILFATVGNPTVSDSSSWAVNKVSPGSAAERFGLQTGDRVLSVGGEQVDSFTALKSVLDRRAGDEAVVRFERNGQVLEQSGVLGWRLNPSGAGAIPGMQALDSVLAPGDGNDVYPGTFEDFSRELSQGTGPYTFRFERSGYIFENTVERPVTVPADGASGFFGISSKPPALEPEPLPSAVVDAGEAVGTVVVGSGQALGRLFSPEGLSRYANTVADNVPGQGAASTVRPIRPINPDNTNAAPPTSNADADRPLSVVGAVRFVSDSARDSVAAGFFLFAILNISLGLINLIPLLPFDGGHAVVATYEAMRSRPGKPYRVNIAKLMPITYAVVGLMLVFGLTSIFLDIRAPLSP